MSRYKVLQVIDALHSGGAERVTVDLSNTLHRNGADVSVITIVEPGVLCSELDPEITHINLGRGKKLSLSAMYRFAGIARKFEVIHVHMRHNLKYVWLIKKLFGFPGKIVFQDHYGKIHTDRSLGRMLGYAMADAGYIGVSDELCQWARDVARLPETRVFKLPNIVVRKSLTPSSEKQGADGALIVVANFKPEKNHRFALALCAELMKEREITLDLYGRIADAEYYTSIIREIETKGLSQRVRVITDCTDIQEVLPHYSLALHTAESETGPLVLIEYLSQGLPFVAYRTGEVAEQLAGTFPEMLMESFDVAAWRERIVALLEGRGVPSETEMHRFFDSHYSEKEYSRQCQRVYANVLAS